MTRYFKLRDDEMVRGRWHLAEVRAADGSEPRLRVGIRYGREDALGAKVTHPGRVLDFSLTSSAVPVVSAALADVVVRSARYDVESLPVCIAGQFGLRILNALRLVGCLDESRSEYLKWTGDDHRADLAGQYRQVSKLFVDPDRVPRDASFFRIEGWPIALIVSEPLKLAMESAGCIGALFSEV